MSERSAHLTVDPVVLKLRLIESVTRVVLFAIKCLTIFGVAWLTYLSVDSLAGKVTDAQISILVGYITKTSGGATVGISLLVGALGVVYGLLCNRVRRRVIADFSEYRHRMETRFDQNRTSSMLGEHGRTHPRDR